MIRHVLSMNHSGRQASTGYVKKTGKRSNVVGPFPSRVGDATVEQTKPWTRNREACPGSQPPYLVRQVFYSGDDVTCSASLLGVELIG